MGLFDFMLDQIVESIGNEIIGAAFDDALSTMESMCVNAGQEAVFMDYVVPGFEDALASSSADSGWDAVDIGEYMDFMGEIVEAGNSIMGAAYEALAELGSDGDFSEDEAAEMGDEYEGDF